MASKERRSPGALYARSEDLGDLPSEISLRALAAPGANDSRYQPDRTVGLQVVSESFLEGAECQLRFPSDPGGEDNGRQALDDAGEKS